MLIFACVFMHLQPLALPWAEGHNAKPESLTRSAAQDGATCPCVDSGRSVRGGAARSVIGPWDSLDPGCLCLCEQPRDMLVGASACINVPLTASFPGGSAGRNCISITPSRHRIAMELITPLAR